MTRPIAVLQTLPCKGRVRAQSGQIIARHCAYEHPYGQARAPGSQPLEAMV